MQKNTLKLIMGLGLTMVGALSAYAAHESTPTEKISQNVKDSVEYMKHATSEKKDEAVAKCQILLTDMDHRIQVMEASLADKTNNMTEAARKAKEHTLTKLKAEREDVRHWFEKLKISTRETWENVKHGFTKSYDSFEETYLHN